jgi:hypothetical protein
LKNPLPAAKPNKQHNAFAKYRLNEGVTMALYNLEKRNRAIGRQDRKVPTFYKRLPTAGISILRWNPVIRRINAAVRTLNLEVAMKNFAIVMINFAISMIIFAIPMIIFAIVMKIFAIPMIIFAIVMINFIIAMIIFAIEMKNFSIETTGFNVENPGDLFRKACYKCFWGDFKKTATKKKEKTND